MFDSIATSRPRRPAAGTAVSIALHAVVIGAAVWFTARQIREGPVIVDVLPHIYPQGPKGAAPSPPPPAKSHRRARPHPRPDLAQPVAEPAPQPEHEVVAELPDQPADDESEEAGDSIIGAPGGFPGGDPAGIGDGSGVRDVASGPREFEAGRMTPPKQISGPDPAYTPQALEHEVEGTMAVRCVVTEHGVVHGCRVLKSLPFMDAEVLRALEQRRYTPALIDGRPVEVDYLFQVRLRLPTP
jgi:protein TonB